MFLNKMRILAVLLAIGLTAGAGILSYSKLTAEPPDEKKAEAIGKQENPGKAAEAARRMQRLLKDRLDAAKEEWRSRLEQFLAGKPDVVDALTVVSSRLQVAQQEMSDRKADQLAVREA